MSLEEEVEIIDLDKSIGLDDNWIENQKQEEKKYGEFYKEAQEDIKVVFMYIDKNNTVMSERQIKVKLENSKIKKKQLIDLLNKNMVYNSIKYRPISIIKWVINIEPEELGTYLKDEKEYDFMRIEPEINDIEIEDSIIILHDINSIYILLHESWRSYNNRSKKVYIKGSKLKRKKQTKRLKHNNIIKTTS